MKKYIFRPYSDKYKKYFSLEKSRLRKFLKKDVMIEHIGSTAVKNLGGKGIVDIIIGVKGRLNDYSKKLQINNYNYRLTGGTPKRYFFQKDYKTSNSVRRVHIHLVIYDSDEWIHPLAFRNYLRKNPLIAKEYAKLKKDAVKIAKGDKEKYRAYKERFLRNTTADALKSIKQ